MKNINWVVTIIWGVQYKISTTNEKKKWQQLKKQNSYLKTNPPTIPKPNHI